MEKQINEQESLQLISDMINKAKSDFKDDGKFLLLWGWATLIAAIIHFILLKFTSFEHHYIGWPIIITVTGIIHGILGAKMTRDNKIVSYFDSVMMYLWGAIFISLVIVLSFGYKIGWDTSYPMVMILYGLGTFTTGGVLKFRPLIFGGVAAWCLAIGAFFVSFDIQLLLLGASLILSYIVPGHMLKAQASHV